MVIKFPERMKLIEFKQPKGLDLGGCLPSSVIIDGVLYNYDIKTSRHQRAF